MGYDGAANIIFRKEIEQSEDPVAKRQEKFMNTANSSVIICSCCQRYIDDVIEPEATRPRLISALEMLQSKRENRPPKNIVIFPYN